VKRLTEGDVEAFAAMVVALYAEDAGPVTMTLERARAQARAMLAGAPAEAWVDDSGVGYAILVPFWSNEFGGPMLYLDEVYVVPDARGRGVGTAIVAWARAEAQRRGCVRLALEVNHDNPRARRLYERLGFEVEARSTLGVRL
jgi:GNAT superfamily N-acetyltransferase